MTFDQFEQNPSVSYGFMTWLRRWVDDNSSASLDKIRAQLGAVTVVQDAGGGGTFVGLRVVDPSGNPVFEVRSDGTVHIKSGGSVIADL